MLRNERSYLQFLRMFCISMIMLLFLELGIITCHAEEQNTGPDRPKLGLALGGGSAAGFAHIGVFKWLEENQIPVDYIAGTSMGGLMGGFYAMGMSPGEIRDLVYSTNWRMIFDPNPPYTVMNFRRKEDHHDYSIPVEVGLKEHRFRLPGGLNVYQVGFILSRFTLPYSMIQNFDELPVPFRCTATDISNAESVVMGDGSLAEALRATMAIPGVFTPVERDGRLLVDGGILDNLPVPVVKKMGADIVIAVKVSPFNSPGHMETVDSVLAGSINTVLEVNARLSLEAADVALEPDTGKLGFLNWTKVDEYIALGYQAAESRAADLRRFAVGPSAWQSYLQQRRGRCRSVIPVPEAILVDGASTAHKAVIMKQLQKYTGRPLDTRLLEKDLEAIMGTGLYENIFYKYRISSGKTVLVVKVKEKQYGPPFIRFGFQLTTAGVAIGNSANQIRSRLTAFDIAGPGSELRLDLGIGAAVGLHGELYKPIAGSRWFIAPSAVIMEDNYCLFTAGNPVTTYQNAISDLGLDLGYTFNNSLEARLGVNAGYQTVQTKVGLPLGSDYNGMFRRARLKLTCRDTDNAILPRRGIDWDLNAAWYFTAPGATEEFGLVENKLLFSIPAGSEDIILMIFGAGVALHHSPPYPSSLSWADRSGSAPIR